MEHKPTYVELRDALSIAISAIRLMSLGVLADVERDARLAKIEAIHYAALPPRIQGAVKRFNRRT